MAFKPSSTDGGISVINLECVTRSGISICEHIAKFYPTAAEQSPMFWEFSSEAIVPNAILTQKTGPTGDECHYNITGLTKGDAKKIIYSVPVASAFMCENGKPRALTLEDMSN